jgi:hypothetical protein
MLLCYISTRAISLFLEHFKQNRKSVLIVRFFTQEGGRWHSTKSPLPLPPLQPRASAHTAPGLCGRGGLLVFSIPGPSQPKCVHPPMEQQILGILGGSASDQSKVHSNPKPRQFNTARHPTRSRIARCSLLTSSSACRHPQSSLPIACRATPSLRQGCARRRRCGRQADLPPDNT